MTYTSDELVYAAEKLLACLPPVFQTSLSALLTRARNGEAVDNQIIDLLIQDQAARRWMKLALVDLSNDVVRGYEPLAGSPASIQASSKWKCQECGFEWVVLRAGRPVPPCPHDGSVLILEKEES